MQLFHFLALPTAVSAATAWKNFDCTSDCAKQTAWIQSLRCTSSAASFCSSLVPMSAFTTTTTVTTSSTSIITAPTTTVCTIRKPPNTVTASITSVVTSMQTSTVSACSTTALLDKRAPKWGWSWGSNWGGSGSGSGNSKDCLTSQTQAAASQVRTTPTFQITIESWPMPSAIQTFAVPSGNNWWQPGRQGGSKDCSSKTTMQTSTTTSCSTKTTSTKFCSSKTTIQTPTFVAPSRVAASPTQSVQPDCSRCNNVPFELQGYNCQGLYGVCTCMNTPPVVTATSTVTSTISVTSVPTVTVQTTTQVPPVTTTCQSTVTVTSTAVTYTTLTPNFFLDDNNCGGCGKVCPSGTNCNGSVCVKSY